MSSKENNSNSLSTQSQTENQNIKSNTEIETNESSSIASDYSLIEPNPSELDSILTRINNTSLYDKLITKKIDINLFIQKYDEDPSKAIFTTLPLITMIDSDFGIECLRKTESGTLYSLHEVEQGGLLYVFYQTRSYETTGKYTAIKYWYYVDRKLKYEDFSFVTNGTNANKVIEIDPITNIFIERAKRHNNSFNITASCHYLEDGILILYYEYKNGEFIVCGQDYQQNFNVKEPLHTEEKAELYDGHILSMDMIK